MKPLVPLLRECAADDDDCAPQTTARAIAMRAAADEIEQLRAAAKLARHALSELIATNDPRVYSDALRALDDASADEGGVSCRLTQR